ncbi:MAG: SDR family NAD(P)-dependent oxidoreductase [bacterium]|jgi:3-oxoacyl-[acyl-carrier protein] reductase|nr:SDR family oxidoreductase [candidate division KSB1 bacterium]MDH7560002.1 SDR family NAD(P)-dependent oxidoreductase [bacterium]
MQGTLIGLSGKVALITGASRGIGAAAAELFARAGAHVVVNYFRQKTAADKVVERIRAQGGKALAVCADVSDRPQVEAMIQEAQQAFGTMDVLVNNAGIWTYGAIAEMEEEVWRETMRVNLDSVFYCCRAVVPLMIARGGGRIINVSSTAGQRGEAFHSHYAATKGAIISFTKSLAAELAPHNILVNCVAPGWVDTDMSAEALRQEGEKISATIPLRRAGTAMEVAGAIVFLASDLATYITGEILNVNGGSVLCG